MYDDILLLDNNANSIYTSLGNDFIDGKNGIDSLIYSSIDQEIIFTIEEISSLSFLNYT